MSETIEKKEFIATQVKKELNKRADKMRHEAVDFIEELVSYGLSPHTLEAITRGGLHNQKIYGYLSRSLFVPTLAECDLIIEVCDAVEEAKDSWEKELDHWKDVNSSLVKRTFFVHAYRVILNSKKMTRGQKIDKLVNTSFRDWAAHERKRKTWPSDGWKKKKSEKQ